MNLAPTFDASASRATAVSPALVVFTSVDGALRDDASSSCSGVRPALDLLASHHVPVVLISNHSADELQRLQEGFGQAHPYICDGGRTMHVPRGYFAEFQDLWPAGEAWHTVPLGAADIGRAVRLLVSLFQASGTEVLTVGLGCSWEDRTLLEAVDVPIIIRSDRPDQGKLQRRIPDAYLTTAAGPAGWQEAILGSVSA